MRRPGWRSSASCSTGRRPAAATSTPSSWPGSSARPATRSGTSTPATRPGASAASRTLPYAGRGPGVRRRRLEPARASRPRSARAVDGFAPDCVIITDAWNIEAAAGRGGAGLSDLPAAPGPGVPLPAEQRPAPARPDGPRPRSARSTSCHAGCLPPLPRATRRPVRRAAPAERALAGVGTPEYDERSAGASGGRGRAGAQPADRGDARPLRRAVGVVPWGMDPARFPWPPPEEPAPRR